MSSKSSSAELKANDRKILSIIIIITAILLVTLVPVLVIRAMDNVLSGMVPKLAANPNPLLQTAPRIVLAFFPVWGGWSVAAGIALFYVAWALYKGKKWAKPVAIGLLAVPAITGAYFSGPIMFFASSSAPIFVIVGLIGLIPYFTILLWGQGSAAEKTGRFFLFLMLGVTAAWSFSNGGSSLRMYWARPDTIPLDMSNYGFLLGIPVIWTGVAVAILAIPILAARKDIGYWLAAISMTIILMGNLVLRVTHPTTKEFLIGIIMAVVTLILLFLPSIGRKAVDQPVLE